MASDIALSGPYYPHTSLDSESTLKMALLLWDKLEVIVPDESLRLKSSINNPGINDILDRFCVKRVPSSEEQRQVHEQVEELLLNAKTYEYLNSPDQTLLGMRYEIYPQKLLDETWELLKEYKLVSQDGTKGYFPNYGLFQDIVTSQKMGLLIMLYLAQACAGTTRRLITDQISSYQALNKSLSSTFEQVTSASSDMERIVTRSLKVLDADQLSLEQLLRLRDAEEKPSGQLVRAARHRYLELIDKYAEQLKTASETDIPELERVQRQEMKDSVETLKDAMEISATKILLEKELYVAILAVAGAFVHPITLAVGIPSIISLGKTLLDYKKDRRAAMEKHAMSWLIQATNKSQHSVY